MSFKGDPINHDTNAITAFARSAPISIVPTGFDTQTQLFIFTDTTTSVEHGSVRTIVATRTVATPLLTTIFTGASAASITSTSESISSTSSTTASATPMQSSDPAVAANQPQVPIAVTVVLAVIVGVSVCAAIILLICRRKRRKTQDTTPSESLSDIKRRPSVQTLEWNVELDDTQCHELEATVQKQELDNHVGSRSSRYGAALRRSVKSFMKKPVEVDSREKFELDASEKPPVPATDSKGPES